MIGRLGVRRVCAVFAVFAAVIAISGAALAQSEGIKVHGRWTIEVRNADGTLVSRTEFENALAPHDSFDGLGGGAGALAGLLSRTYSVRAWRIHLHGSPSPWGTAGNAIIAEDTSHAGGLPHMFHGLTVTVPTATNGQYAYATGTVQLEGSATALNAGAIVGVRTQIENGTPGGPGYVNVTLKSITPISVASGQIIQVKVVLSFS